MSQDLLRQLIHQGAQFRKLVSEITTRIKELEEMVVSQFARIQTLEAEIRQYKVANRALYQPNTATVAAIEAVERGEDMKSFNSVKELFKDLHADD